MKYVPTCLFLLFTFVSEGVTAQPWGCYDPKPPHPTPTEKNQYIKLVSDLATTAEKRHGVPAAAIAAMAIAESGYGWTRTALEANNLFGWKYNSASAAGGRSFYELTCQPADDKNNKYIKFRDAADSVDFVAGKLAVLPAYAEDTRKYQAARRTDISAVDASREWIKKISDPYNWKPDSYVKTIIRIMNNPQTPSDTISDTFNLYRLSKSTPTPSPARLDAPSVQSDGLTLAQSIFSSALKGQNRKCESPVQDFPGWQGYPVRKCEYSDSGVSVQTYMLNPTIKQLAHWTATACVDAGSKNIPACVKAVSHQILSASSGVFPVAGFIPEPASSAGGKGKKIFCFLFRDGVTVSTNETPLSPAAIEKRCPSFDLTATIIRAKKFARVASTSRDDYRANGGAETVGTDKDGDPRWLEVVRSLYQKAWNDDRNELISAKAKALRSKHMFD